MDNVNEDDDTSLLVIIVDLNAYSWGKQVELAEQNIDSTSGSRFITLSTFFEHLVIFINAYLLLNQENQIAVISSNVGESSFIYPSNHVDTKDKSISFKISQSLNNISKHLIEEIHLTSEENSSSSSFSAAMSLALCYINRIKKDNSTIRSRILVFNISPDVSTQYIPVMNCIFSAQKQSIPVDSCILTSTDSTFLQQASHLTNGIYLRPHRQDHLGQYLLSSFLIDSYSRKFLNVPTLKTVDYRASCFCHKKIVDIGFVCSVCLSIYCKYSSSCTTCGTKFTIKFNINQLKTSSSSSSSQSENK
ncbi:general transcription factor IIH [Cavenderia fasciculata]|uniref:General transcription factor IIH subunit 3 n=1 Tax=Cavenderia fasciculata TaxID=261658 RepID=F4PMD8_CACFS|nr:general transcription factor IIH [Cavenderia fasciculata]EGG22788.1 general transcription factor IIH [Cavenderia fasciculata]|eukprot:XP_004360639.1 general transcription factor IIH [Cavenderia fasciculata]